MEIEPKIDKAQHRSSLVTFYTIRQLLIKGHCQEVILARKASFDDCYCSGEVAIVDRLILV